MFENDTYMNIYTVAYKLCTQRAPYNFSEQLYRKHGEVIRTYLVTKAIPKLRGNHGTYLLETFVAQWELHKILNKWMNKFLVYLDRFHCTHHNLPQLLDAGNNAFREVVFDEISSDVTAAMLELISKERGGESVDTELLKKVVEVYKVSRPNLAAYESAFEVRFLQESSIYYQTKAQDWIQSDSTPMYLIKVENAIKAERARVASYLVPSTEAKVEVVLVNEMLKEQETTLLEKEGSGVKALLRDDKKDDLARIFRMFEKIPNGLQPIAVIVKDHIQGEGQTILDKRAQKISEAEGKEGPLDSWFVQALLDLHDKYRALVQEQFNGDPQFQKALKYAFEHVCNSDIGKYSVAELLGMYADSVLKSGGEEKLSEAQIEDVLEKICQLFSFLAEKDVFADVYRTALSKRLLNQRSASEDAERSMIAKLKLRCGAQFTAKIEGMLTDLLLGRDLSKKFSTHLENMSTSDRPPIENFSVEVLTTGHWPTFKNVEPTLPPVFSRCVQVYQKFYETVTDHRKLTWLNTQGTASVKATFKPSSIIELQLSTLQAIALQIFNEIQPNMDPWITFEQLNERLGKDQDVTKRVAHSLSCQKGLNILIKEPPEARKIEITDKFRANADFTSKMRKLRIPMASLEETHNPQRVEEDRGMAIEAAIVRIMKARKRLNFTTLVAEVIQQLVHFKPQPKVVKKKIELLLDREYLARDETDPNFYKYVA
jgi:cullin 1